MNLSAPSQTMFWISVVLAVLALLGTFLAIPFVTAYAVWVALVAYLVLLVGNLTSGM